MIFFVCVCEDSNNDKQVRKKKNGKTISFQFFFLLDFRKPKKERETERKKIIQKTVDDHFNTYLSTTKKKELPF